MVDASLDGTVSPMSHTPLPSTPANEATSAFQPPSTPKVHVQAPPGEKPSANNTSKIAAEARSAPEASDYWNGGETHDNVSPVKNGDLTQRDKPLPSLPLGETHGSDDTNAAASFRADSRDCPVPGTGRSVQFAEKDSTASVPASPSHTRHGSWDGPDSPSRHMASSLMSRIKALSPGMKSLALPGLSPEHATQSGVHSPSAPRLGNRLSDTLMEESAERSDTDADADVETADEAAVPGKPSANVKRKRRMRRFAKGHAPSPSFTNRFAGNIDTSAAYSRLLRRRASMPDTSAAATVPEHGLSEGEAHSQYKRRGFRRGHSYVGTTTTHQGDDVADLESSAVIGRRTGHLRRITVFGGGGVSDGDALTPRRPFFNSERASNYGAQKWKQVKSTLKLLRQKKEDRFDYLKSAELMAELRAGAPAALMLASMIQRDEHGNKRIPVLLEQLKLRITDSSPVPDDDKDRHWHFTMELEYGSGPSRMSWTVVRTVRDIYNLHFRYRFALNNEKYMLGRDLSARPKQPKFPYSAFPYLRRARDKGDESDDDEQDETGHEDAAGEPAIPEEQGDGTLSGAEGRRGPARKKSLGNLWGMRRRSTGFTDADEMSNVEGLSAPAVDMATRRQRYVEKQRRILEKYLSEMIRWLMFRADSNRLCRFLELSALGVRLAAEGSYHGKEGYLHIQTSKGLDFRRVMTPAKVIARHSRKWFLVRQSYIACVESPENMNIYDVYLVDTKFSIMSKKNALKQITAKDKRKEIDLTAESPLDKHHTLTLNTSERKVRLFSRNQSVMKQFEESINEMLRQTAWYEKKRFDSFAPVRTGVFAQWLVDGRDYMWNVSRAINMAKDVIYIHDWWLSPELYMRRPACISQKWRLDRLLQKKAREGVKIFVIIYRNVEAAIPIDSEYTKFSLLNLHPNIFVQRSPNQFKKNQFFFAHHEKICIVDHDVAFLGGIDLCFGRWDCPQHPIVDDKPTGFEMTEKPKDAEHCQLFAGKDYSNPRVQDFFRLNEPYEEMYDRGKVPRMPWHDVGMQVVGQPARDLTRHFVQRWNYLRRGRKPTRPLPFLLPPPDAKVDELEAMGLTGTCEVQMLRSASTWSLGIEHTEHSIQNAYIKMIEDSEHFVYVENQFFITSTEAYNTKIVNRIGDALVDRITRAYRNNETWRCVIVIPLMPGFQNTVDEQEGTSVRLILMCQFKSICRGEQSIFGRLRAAGIEPEDYISFFSLRQWGSLSNDVLVTEQLYIHAKTIIVDDRVALIGSANINERSMLGTRDSECAALVRDTDMIWSEMAGKPYQVGRFAHTLRLRLMREHLGLDVDEILEQERQQELDREAFEQKLDDIYREDRPPAEVSDGLSRPGLPQQHRSKSINHEMDKKQAHEIHDISSSPSSGSSQSSSQAESSSPKKGKIPATDFSAKEKLQKKLDVSGYGQDRWKAAEQAGFDEGRDSIIVGGREVMVHDVDGDGKGTIDSPRPTHRTSTVTQDNRYADPSASGTAKLPPMPSMNRKTTSELGLLRPAHLPPLPVLDDTDIGGPPAPIDQNTGRPKSGIFLSMSADIQPAHISKDCMRDPVSSNFIDEVWCRAAINNTKLYRRVFRCMPDSDVTTWAEYREYVSYGARFRASMEGKVNVDEGDLQQEQSNQRPEEPGHDGSLAAPGIGAPSAIEATKKSQEGWTEKLTEKIPALGQESSEPKTETHDETPIDEKAELAKVEAKETGKLNGDEAPSTLLHKDASSMPSLESAPTKQPDFEASKAIDRKTTFSGLDGVISSDPGNPPGGPGGSVKRRRPRGATKSSRRGFTIEDMPTRPEAEDLLNMIQGNIVQFPYDWLLTEDQNGNWSYQVDGVAPLSIYN